MIGGRSQRYVKTATMAVHANTKEAMSESPNLEDLRRKKIDEFTV